MPDISSLGSQGDPWRERLKSPYNYCMAKHVIHISEMEAARHFAALLANLRAGEKIVIED